MRSFLFKKERFVRRFYKILTVFLAICWVAIGVVCGYYFIQKKFVYPLKYKEEVIQYSTFYNLEPTLIFAVVKTESSFKADAKSSKGAIGLMQLTKSTGEYVASLLGEKNFNLENPNTNIKYGCFYIRYLKNKFKTDRETLSAYNAGEGVVSSWLKNTNYSADGKTLDKIPFAETKEYLKKIEKTFNKYKKLYGNIVDKR